MLASKERDFIFIRGPHAEAFWDGYGQEELDWRSMTYYLWERVVQDLIEYATIACVSTEVAEATREDAAQRFEANLAGGAIILTAAGEAATHLTL